MHSSLHPVRRKLFITNSIIAMIGAVILLGMFWEQSIPYIIASTVLTTFFTWQQFRVWNNSRSRWKRILFAFLSSFSIVVLLMILLFLLTEDPFASQRITKSGWVQYVLLDKVLRGLLFGVVLGSISLSPIWIPIGIVWYALLRWSMKAENEFPLKR